MKCNLLKENESGAKYKKLLEKIIIRKEECDINNSKPDFIFDNSEKGENTMQTLVQEIFHEEVYEKQVQNIFIARCPVHQVMKLIKKDGEHAVNNNHQDASFL